MMMKIFRLLLVLLIFGFETSLYAQESTSDSTECTSPYAIGITGAIGIGFVRDIWSPAIKIDFRFLKKESYKIKAGMQLQYFAQKNVTNEYINTFSNFVTSEFWHYHRKNEMWIGGGLAYLISDQGNVFGENTCKVFYGTTWKIFDVRGELYFSDNFKTFFPGITILFGMP